MSTDFVPFATASNANVTPQATYIAEPTTSAGFSSGVASSADCNKAWRQGTMVAAAVANFISNELGINIPDDGNLTNLILNLTAAINVPITTAKNAAESYATSAANTAQNNAQSYAISQALAAQDNAESYAASQAAAAEAAAIASASATATTKANTAQTNAITTSEGYTNTQVSAEASARAAAIAVAQSNAESYASSVANTAQENAQAYADTAASNALTNAETYARGTSSIGPASGWYELPNGIIKIYGTMGAQGTNEPLVSMSRSFPTACIGVIATPISPSVGNASICNVVAKPAAGATSFYLNMSVQSLSVYWEATGY